MNTPSLNRYQYFLNSAQAEYKSPTTAFCEFNLKQKLTLTNANYQFEASVNRVNLPFTFYQWNDNNNTLPFTVTWGMNSNTETITVTPGNYTLTSLIQEINYALPGKLATATSGFVTAAQLAFTYNQNSNKLKFQLVGSGGFTVAFAVSELCDAFGFRTGLTLVCNGLFVTGAHTVNVNPLMNVFITSMAFQDSSSFQALNGSINVSNIIASVPIVHGPLYYQPSDFNVPIKIRLTNETISTMDFDIVDSKGRTLFFDQPWSIQLTIDEIFVGQGGDIVSMHDAGMLASVNAESNQGQSSDVFQELKDQILSQSQKYVQKRQTNSETRSREKLMALRSSKRKNPNSN